MKNKDIILISDVLAPLELDIQQSSARRRLLRVLGSFIEDYEIVRKELCEKYAIKLPNGGFDIVDNNYQFTPQNQKTFNKELEKLQELEVEVDFSKNEKDKELCLNLLKEQAEKIEKESGGKMDAITFDKVESIREILLNNGIK